MNFAQLGVFLLAAIGTLVGISLILLGWAGIVWGRSKEHMVAYPMRRVGTWLTGTCLGVLIILYFKSQGI